MRLLTLGDTTQRVQYRVKEMAALRRGSGAAAVLGNNVLMTHRVYFDPAEHMVRLIATGDAPLP